MPHSFSQLPFTSSQEPQGAKSERDLSTFLGKEAWSTQKEQRKILRLRQRAPVVSDSTREGTAFLKEERDGEEGLREGNAMEALPLLTTP